MEICGDSLNEFPTNFERKERPANVCGDFLNKLFTKGLLDKFETRYVIYDPAVALRDLDKSLIGGQKLELGILNNRKNTYYYESQKEINRIEMIEKRVNSQI